MFLVIIIKYFLSFNNFFFYTQQAFAFLLLRDLCNVHNHIVAIVADLCNVHNHIVEKKKLKQLKENA